MRLRRDGKEVVKRRRGGTHHQRERGRELTGQRWAGSGSHDPFKSDVKEAKLLVSPFLISRSKSICFLREELRSELGGGSPAKTEKDSERLSLWKLNFTGEFALP